MVDAIIMVSHKCPIIAEHVDVNFVAKEGTIAMIGPIKNTLNSSFKHLQLKNELGDPHFSLSNCDKHDKMQLFTKFKSVL